MGWACSIHGRKMKGIQRFRERKRPVGRPRYGRGIIK